MPTNSSSLFGNNCVLEEDRIPSSKGRCRHASGKKHGFTDVFCDGGDAPACQSFVSTPQPVLPCTSCLNSKNDRRYQIQCWLIKRICMYLWTAATCLTAVLLFANV